MMKILLVHKFFKYNGGADVFFFEVGRVLRENGHQVAVFSTKDKDNLPSEWSSYFADAPGFRTSGVAGKLRSFLKIPYNLETKKKFGRLLDDFKPDLVHVFNIMTQLSPSVLVAARERRIPVVMSLNDYKHLCPSYKLFFRGEICEACRGGAFYHCLLKRCAHGSLSFSLASCVEAYLHAVLDVYHRNVTLFLFASDFMAAKTEAFWKRPFEKGKLANPFGLPPRPDLSVRGEYGLYFGRLSDEKGVDVLLKALAGLKKLPFKVVGEGPERENLQKMAADNGLDRVEFTGPKWGAEMDGLLSECKYVVVPSLWPENFPYVVIQAFAAGKPVIGSAGGGIPELVTPERGLLYPPTAPGKLAEMIRKLESDPALCRKMGENAREFVENTFNDGKFYQAIISNYRRAVELNANK